MSLRRLADECQKRAKEIDEAGNEAAKTIGLAIVEYLVNNTPVDTSQALSNWQLTIGSPASSTIPAYSEGSHGSSKAASAAAAISNAENALAGKRPGQSIFITNNLDYIEGLNNGSISKQPSGFFEAALIIARDMLNTLESR